MNKDVQLKTLAKTGQGSRQPHLANMVMWTEHVLCVTRYYIFKNNILAINIIIVTTIIIIITFLVWALNRITEK